MKLPRLNSQASRTEKVGTAGCVEGQLTQLPAVLFGKGDLFLKMFSPRVHLASPGSCF